MRETSPDMRYSARYMLVWVPERLSAPQRHFLADFLTTARPDVAAIGQVRQFWLRVVCNA